MKSPDMCEIKIVNRQKGEYIGRGSPLGNPYIIGKDGTRDEVCNKYEQWFEENRNTPQVRQELIRLYRKAKNEGEITLSCFCYPKRCHGETIKRFLEKYL